MNAAQVRAKARMAVKRFEEEIEHEEMEAGELNLVPYLDIVTNILLFLLASIASGLVLGHINTSLPEYSKAGAGGPAGEPQMQLVLSITNDKLDLFDQSEGDMAAKGSINNPFVSLSDTKAGPEYEFDYVALSKAATQIVKDRFGSKYPLSVGDDKKTPACKDDKKGVYPLDRCRPVGSTKVIIIPEQGIPYYTIVAAMDAVRTNIEVNMDPATKVASPKYGWPENVLFPDVIFGTIAKN